jgi:hypothetical protein
MSDQKYIPFNIYQKIERSRESNKKEDGTPLKSIYAKNHNMFMNAVPFARDGVDRGLVAGGGEGKRVRPIINKNKDDKQNELKKTNLTVDLDGDNNNEDKD